MGQNAALPCRLVNQGPLDKVTSEQTMKEQESKSSGDVVEKCSRQNGKCKGPEVGVYLKQGQACWYSKKKAESVELETRSEAAMRERERENMVGEGEDHRCPEIQKALLKVLLGFYFEMKVY